MVKKLNGELVKWGRKGRVNIPTSVIMSTIDSDIG